MPPLPFTRVLLPLLCAFFLGNASPLHAAQHPNIILIHTDDVGLGNIHCFNAGSTMSHAAVAGDIPGLAFGANRLSRAIARSLFLASAEKLQEALHAHDDRELEPTRYFLPR